MRFLILLVAGALAVFRPGPAEAVAIGLHNSLLGAGEGVGDQADVISGGFGQWVALDGDRVLIGARGDADEIRADTPFATGFVFNTRNGEMLHRFDRPTLAQPNLVKPGILIDSFEVTLPAEASDQHAEPIRLSMGTGTLNWTAHRMEPSAATLRRAVASDDVRILIGAPIGTENMDGGNREVHLYSSESGELLQSFAPPADLAGANQGEFGRSVAFSRDLVLIGAPGDSTDGSDVGGAYLFSAETGRFLHRFQAPEISGADRFGTSVAINEHTIAIGAPGNGGDSAGGGEAYLFSSGDYVMTQALHAPWHFRTGDRPTDGRPGDYRQGDIWHSAGRSGGFGGIGGGGGGSGGGSGGGGYLPGDPDDDRPVFILPDPNNPDQEMPETPIAIPLPAGLALYLAALSMGGILIRRRSAG